LNITKVERAKSSLIKLYNALRIYFELLPLTAVFIAIVGAAVISFSFLLFMDTVMWDMTVCTFLITFSVYSLNRLTDIEEDASNMPERVAFLSQKKDVILILSITSYLIALIVGALKNMYIVLVFLTPLLIGIIYSIRISSFRIKNIFAMKNVSVAFSWAFSSSFLPYVFYPNISVALMLFIFLFIKCFMDTVVFDIRDIEGDRISGVKTLPVVLGIKRTRNVLLAVNSFLLIWVLVCYLMGIFIPYLPIAIFSTIYGYWYISVFFREENKKGKYDYDYLVDGEFIILAILAAFVHIIVT